MKLSIKYKFFLLSLIIPLLSLFAYARFSDSIFRHDKEAYIYGDGVLQTKSASRVLETVNETVHNVLRFLVRNGGVNSKTKKEIAAVFPRVRELKLIPGAAVGKDWDYSIQENGLLAVGVPFGPKGTVRLVLEGAEILDMFKSEKVSTTFLLDENLNLLAGDKGQWKKFVSEKELQEQISKAGLLSGNFPLEAGDKEWLAAYSRSRDGGLTIVRAVEKSAAYEALDILSKKSWIFFAVIFFVVMILSLLAASRTTEDLRKLHEATGDVSRGRFDVDVDIKSKDEVGDLALAFKEMAKKVSQLLNELKLHNERLEVTVQERTAQLREALNIQEAMVNSLSEGFFVYDTNQKKKIIETQSCEKIFGSDFKRLSLAEILEGNEEGAESIEEVLDSIGQGFMSFKDASALLPRRRSVNGKSVFFHYYPMGGSKDFRYLVVQAEDRTNEIRAQEKFEEEVRTAKALSSFIRHRTAVEDFLDSYKSFLGNIEKNKMDPANLKRWKHDAHTLKGNAGILDLHGLMRALHQFEEALTGEIEADISKGLIELKRALEDFSSVAGGVVTKGRDERKKSISEKAIKELVSEIEKNGNPELLKEVRKKLLAYSVSELFVPIMDKGEEMSHAAGKKAVFTLKSPELLSDDERLPKVVEVLVHVYRNALAHGIEFPIERSENGKNETGTVDTFIKVEQGKLLIKIHDDGKGMNEEMISDILSGTASSSSSSVNDLSGRGWGMKAVKETIEKLDGKFFVEGRLGQGTTFMVQLNSFEVL